MKTTTIKDALINDIYRLQKTNKDMLISMSVEQLTYLQSTFSHDNKFFGLC